MFYGPTPVDEALRWYEEQQAQHPIALTQQAMLEAMRGNFDRARALAGSADAAAEEFGQKLWLAAGGMALWEIETPRRRPVRRRARGPAKLRAAGGARRGRVPLHGREPAGRIALRPRASRRGRRVDSNRRGARRRATTSPRRCSGGRCGLRSSLVAASTRRPSSSPAKRSRSRKRRTCSTSTATPSRTSAEVYALAGRTEDAREQLEQALVLYERKGNLVAAGRARGRLEELGACHGFIARPSLLASSAAATEGGHMPSEPNRSEAEGCGLLDRRRSCQGVRGSDRGLDAGRGRRCSST